ncbi:P-loop containing nucleoside triphosphate hydrolase protein [Macrophomina phaseolina]|uniref:P-loop containing nucleoside triphosphate hydrolase protein n=1 Tax=Macrophomina phaseolina TaxID=35725 RepID=A0ABQ8G765_9PEZI|nr:P-loop containing nucleoside triphosphate hydrolase protein [Macrophomina phaseolina]
MFYTQLLVNFIEYCLKPHIARVTSEDFQDISFPDLWYLFKPGGLVVSANEDQAYRVIEVVYRANAPGSMASFGVKCVHMDYDGQKIGPVISLFWVGKYFGKRNVATLPVYPLRCNDDPSGLQRILVDRGRKSMKAIISRHMHCMGATLNDHQAVNGQVMIDFEGALAHNSHWRPEILSIGESLFDKQGEKGSTEENGPAEFSSDRELASEYLMKHELTDPYLRSRKMAGGETSVGDDELMLLTHRLFGFILRTRKWASFSIEDMREVSNMADAESFKRLVLPQGHKAMLESLVRSHFRQREGKMHRRKQSNTIRGEGPGLNVLLHGGPGTGKTWTAECIAGAFEKPLFSITCGELGNTSTEIIKQVEIVFSLAQKWDCVLLLDDADMLFSERTKNDFSRDSLVSGFLRALDHYSGILFLTTSRVSVFDESFRSRIQFSLYYPPLDDKSSLEVWEVGIWQTRRRQRNIRIKDEEILEFAQELWDTGDYHFRWNGRQIRNAFQTALALAEADAHNESMPARRDSKGQSAVTLRRRHFEKVAKAGMAFEQRLPNGLGSPPTDQPPAQDLKRSNTGRTRERASTMPGLTRRPSHSLASAGPLPPLPALLEGGPTRRPSVASKPNRQTHRARSSVGTSLRQEIWPGRDSCESVVPVPELPKRESTADMWEVDRDRHDFTMRTPYEQLRL